MEGLEGKRVWQADFNLDYRDEAYYRVETISGVVERETEQTIVFADPVGEEPNRFHLWRRGRQYRWTKQRLGPVYESERDAVAALKRDLFHQRDAENDRHKRTIETIAKKLRAVDSVPTNAHA